MTAVLARLSLFALPLLAVTMARAGLVWEKTEVAANLPPGETSITLRVPFKNSGPATVRVLKIHADCGCTKAGTDREEYPAGASGELLVEYRSTGTGRQHREVQIETDEPGAKPQVITLAINAPEWLVIAPHVLTWMANPAQSDPRIATADVPEGINVEILRVASSSPAFTARLLPIEKNDPPRRRRIEVTPVAAGTPVLATISVVVRLPSGKETEKKLYVRVR